MKKIMLFLLTLVLLSAGLFCNGRSDGAADSDKVVLTMGSWRTDDVEQMNAVLAAFSETHPGIEIQFQPTNPPDYNATLRLQLESGTGPDLMYARSYATGQQLFEDGYFADVSDVPGVQSAYDDGTRSPWTAADGRSFAVPFVAVSHGIYFNKDIFAELGISVPETWDDLLETAEKIKAAGYIPFANGLGDEWDIAEVVFMSIAPNFIGGYEGRLAYEQGKKEFNGPEVVALFEAMDSLQPYLPSGYKALGYNDSNALFATGQAAMYFDGSWSIGTFADVDFDWDVFPPPVASKGDKGQVCFHADAGMTMNAATGHPEEAREFLAWLSTGEGAEALAENLPTGFFPMSSNAISIPDAHANSFLAMNKGRGTDVRWAWPELLAGTPSGYDLMMNGSIAVLTDAMTPREAADAFAEGLALWYPPAQ